MANATPGPGAYKCRNTETGEISTFIVNGKRSGYQYGAGSDHYGCTESEAIERYQKWRENHADRMDIIVHGCKPA